MDTKIQYADAQITRVQECYEDVAVNLELICEHFDEIVSDGQDHQGD